MIGRQDESAVTRTSLMQAAFKALDDDMHTFVPHDEHRLSCAQCQTAPTNRRHRSDLRAVVVVRNPQGSPGPIPREWAAVQIEIPTPRPGTA